MRASAASRPALALAGAAALLSQGASAQNTDLNAVIDLLPQCALECMLPLVNVSSAMSSQDAICDGTDMKCMCTSPSFLGKTEACVSTQCTVEESLVAKNATTTSCGYPVRDDSPKLIITASVFSAISALFVLQRFAVKIFSPDLLLGLDDWMVLLAALIQAPCVAIACVPGVANGLGKDIWKLTPEQITNFAYYLYVYTTIYFVNIAVCKLSFLLFYLRVFPAPRVRSILWATVGFVGVYGTFFFFMNTFQCTPIAHYWHRWDRQHEGKCLNASVIAWANAAISISIDLWMICIPLWQLKGVNLDWKKKLGVGLMFCVGLFSTIVSSIRLSGLVQHNWASPNQSWVKLDLAIWCCVEVNVAIICACLPAFRSLLVRLFPFLPLGAGTHRDHTKEDFVEGNRELGFGTISRSVAEKTHSRHLPIVPGAIAMSRTYKVEHTIERAPGAGRGSGSTDHRDLMRLPSLEEFNSSDETLDGRSSHDGRSSREARQPKPRKHSADDEEAAF